MTRILCSNESQGIRILSWTLTQEFYQLLLSLLLLMLHTQSQYHEGLLHCCLLPTTLHSQYFLLLDTVTPISEGFFLDSRHLLSLKVGNDLGILISLKLKGLFELMEDGSHVASTAFASHKF